MLSSVGGGVSVVTGKGVPGALISIEPSYSSSSTAESPLGGSKVVDPASEAASPKRSRGSCDALIARWVFACDLRSSYPSKMLTRRSRDPEIGEPRP